LSKNNLIMNRGRRLIDMKKSVWVYVKVYIFYFLQVIMYNTPFRNYFRFRYIRSFYYDWLGNKRKGGE
jgi:hypothetical protein